jgi:hypothetical protein
MMLHERGMRRVTAITYHADLKEVQGDAVIDPASATAPFDRLSWWQGLAEYCGISPFLAVARDGVAVAMLPLAGGSGHLQGLSNYYTFRLKPLFSNGGEALLPALARDLASRCHRITLTGVPDEDGTATLLENAFRSAGWLVAKEPCDTNHILNIKGRSFAEYLASRPGPLRTTLKRKANKVEFSLFRAFDAAAWADYEAIYQHSWKPSEGSPSFLRAFAKAEGAAGRLRLAIAHAEGRAVAAQLWTVEGGTAWIHKLAHTQDSRPLSPGTTLSAALFEEVIDRDHVQMVDFGTGNDGYKRDWMEEVRLRYRLDMLRPQNPRNWPYIAKAALCRLAGKAKHG